MPNNTNYSHAGAKRTRASVLLSRFSALDKHIRWIDHMPKIEGLRKMPAGIYCGIREASAIEVMKENHNLALQCDINYQIPGTGYLQLHESKCRNAVRAKLLERMVPLISKTDPDSASDIRLELQRKKRRSLIALVRDVTCAHPQAVVELMAIDPELRAIDCHVKAYGQRVRVLFFRAEEIEDVRVRWHDEIEAVLY
jgi:hypothetical protein